MFLSLSLSLSLSLCTRGGSGKGETRFGAAVQALQPVRPIPPWPISPNSWGARILADARDPRGRSSSSRNSAAAAGGDGVVAELVRLHEHCLGLVEGPFQGSPLFHKSLKEALEDVVNSRVNDVSVGEMLAGRFHHLLKKGGASKGAPPEKLNQEISQLVALFGYLTDNLIEVLFYRNDLAWRLLHNKSASMDMERVVIGKLKYSCGAQYTSK
eukprot:jgi/Bigna1/84566/fgenesh1_pg.160_\